MDHDSPGEVLPPFVEGLWNRRPQPRILECFEGVEDGGREQSEVGARLDVRDPFDLVDGLDAIIITRAKVAQYFGFSKQMCLN